MKNFVLVLALAVFCGVTLANNCSHLVKAQNEAVNYRQKLVSVNAAEQTMIGYDNYLNTLKNEVRICLQYNLTNSTGNLTHLQVCVNSIETIQKARKAIEVEKKRYSPDQKVIAKHQEEITFATQVSSDSCHPEIQCGFGKAEMKFYEDAIVAEKKRYAPDANVLEKLEKAAIDMKVRVIFHCNQTEVCQFSKNEINKYEQAIETEKKRYSPDQQRIERLKSDMGVFKFKVYAVCPTHEVCEVIKHDFNKARNEIAAEKKRYSPDEKNIERLQNEVESLREGLFQSCNTTDVCKFVDQDIQVVEGELAQEKRRYSPDQKRIEKFQAAIAKLQHVKQTRCTGFRLLAEKTIRGARFLANLMKH